MPESKQTPAINPFKKAQASTKKAIIISLVSILLAIIAGLVAFFALQESYNSSRNIGTYASNVHTHSMKVAQNLQKNITLVESQLKDLQTKLNDAENKLEQLSNLNLQSYDQREFSQASYLIHLANLHLIITQDTDVALSLLKAAQKQLNQISNPSITKLKQALAKNITELENVPSFDMPTLLARLQKLKDDVTNLPIFPKHSLQTPEATHEEDTSGTLPWYKKVVQNLSGLKDLVIIRHNKEPVKPLLSPEQLLFLKENVQLKISEAEWAALHHNPVVYQESLTRAKELLQQFYPNPDTIASLVNTFDELLEENIKPTLPDLSETLSILHTTTLHFQNTPKQQDSDQDNKSTDTINKEPSDQQSGEAQ